MQVGVEIAQFYGAPQPLRQPGSIQLHPFPVQYPCNDPLLRIKQGRGQKTPLAVAQLYGLPEVPGRPFTGIGIGDDPWVPQFQHPDGFRADNSCSV